MLEKSRETEGLEQPARWLYFMQRTLLRNPFSKSDATGEIVTNLSTLVNWSNQVYAKNQENQWSRCTSPKNRRLKRCWKWPSSWWGKKESTKMSKNPIFGQGIMIWCTSHLNAHHSRVQASIVLKINCSEVPNTQLPHLDFSKMKVADTRI